MLKLNRNKSVEVHVIVGTFYQLSVVSFQQFCIQTTRDVLLYWLHSFKGSRNVLYVDG